jgi:ABC-type bacteriocin/lantibiotic exporter with double-glycine peptidase domain
MRYEPPWREQGDCGPLSLYVLMRIQDREVSLQEDVKKLLPHDPDVGCSLADMARAADALDFPVEVRFVNPRDLPKLQPPFIVHVAGSLERGTGHFLVVIGYSPELRQYSAIDTTYGGLRAQTEESLLFGFTGYALVPKHGTGAILGHVDGKFLMIAGCCLALLTLLKSRFHGRSGIAREDTTVH